MTIHHNSAYRIYSLLSHALEHPPLTLSAIVWAKVFGVIDATGPNNILLVNLIDELRNEARRVQRQMRTLGLVSFQLYNPMFNHIDNALYIDLLSEPWDIPRNCLLSSNLTLLRTFSEMLPDEAMSINEEDIIFIGASTRDLRNYISKLPMDARDLLYHYIDLIDHALLSYRIIGDHAFTIALNNTLLYAMRSLENAEDDDGVAHAKLKLSELWIYLKGKVSDVNTIIKLYGAARTLFDVSANVIAYLP